MLVLLLISLCCAGALGASCPTPLTPDHGQVSLYKDGNVAKYMCELGYKLLGKEIVQCVDGNWEGELPTCIQIEENFEDMSEPVPPPLPPSRPRFSWDEEAIVNPEPNPIDEMLMSDDPQVGFHPKRLLRTNKLEKEAKKEKIDVQLEGPTGKADSQKKTVNKTASVEISMDSDEAMQNDKGEDQLRQMYWYAHYNHYNYPASSALWEYASGYPGVMSLTDSQIAWINSLPADMREQYLRNYYVVRAGGAVDGARVEALRHYQDMYNYYNYYSPYYQYTRQPVSVVAEEPTYAYDYSCNQAGEHFVKAPKLANAYVTRYDARQNSRRSHYLAAIYRCNTGYVMLDNRFTELYCSRRGWVGTQPVCVRRS